MTRAASIAKHSGETSFLCKCHTSQADTHSRSFVSKQNHAIDSAVKNEEAFVICAAAKTYEAAKDTEDAAKKSRKAADSNNECEEALRIV